MWTGSEFFVIAIRVVIDADANPGGYAITIAVVAAIDGKLQIARPDSSSTQCDGRSVSRFPAENQLRKTERGSRHWTGLAAESRGSSFCAPASPQSLSASGLDS